MAKKYLVINKATDKILMIADDEDSAYTFIKLDRLNYEDFSIEKVEMKYFGKSIIISINPKWVCKILNGEKTLEIRKLFPKDYVGWVYIYCTKGNRQLIQTEYKIKGQKETLFELVSPIREMNVYKWLDNIRNYLNGKVVARFWCDKVEEIRCSWGSNFIDWSKYPSDERYDYYIGNEMDTCDICRVACLKMEELDNYLKGEKGYAIHITRLEIFDKPMLITMFRKVGFRKARMENGKYKERQSVFELLREWSLTKSPQSWQYIED